MGDLVSLSESLSLDWDSFQDGWRFCIHIQIGLSVKDVSDSVAD